MPQLPNGLLETSGIGVGCAYLASGYGSYDGIRMIHAAFEAGGRHFDVAPQYGLGAAEEVLGNAVRDRRNQVTLVTKVGIARDRASGVKLMARALAAPLRGYLRAHKSSKVRLASGIYRPTRNFGPDYVRSSLAESLRHLRTSYVDVYLLHMVSLDEITDELIATLAKARQSGAARAIGLATSREETNKILKHYPGAFDVVQYSWSVLDDPLEAAAGRPFRITHRSIMRALRPMQRWLSEDSSTCCRLSDVVETDLRDVTLLPKLLIGAAMAANPGGINLVASRSLARTRENILAAYDERNLILGARLAAALASETNRPSPADE